MAGSSEAPSPRQKWIAIGVSTVPLLASYGMFLYGVVLGGTDEGNPLPWFGLGLFFVPFVYIALAFTSMHPTAPLAVLKSLAVWLLVALPLGIVNVPIGLSTGSGIAGIFSSAEEVHSSWVRAGAVAVGALYVTVLLLLAPPIGAFAGGVVPFIALGFGDMYAEHRAKRSGAGSV